MYYWKNIHNFFNEHKVQYSSSETNFILKISQLGVEKNTLKPALYNTVWCQTPRWLTQCEVRLHAVAEYHSTGLEKYIFWKSNVTNTAYGRTPRRLTQCGVGLRAD